MQATDQSWQTTRNTYEAAALNALKIGVKPVTMRRVQSSTDHDLTEWIIQPVSEDGLYRSGVLRAEFNGGKLQGSLATTLLHPYLIAMRALLNRNRIMDAMKGRPHHLHEDAPGSWILQAGSARIAHTGSTISTVDIDAAVALITIGCNLISITHNGKDHVFTLSRYALPSAISPNAPRIDGGQLYLDSKAGLIFPARKDEPFAIALHALHCLRELRQRQHSNTFIIVSHRTPFHKGAAFSESASSTMKATVQRTLNVRI